MIELSVYDVSRVVSFSTQPVQVPTVALVVSMAAFVAIMIRYEVAPFTADQANVGVVEALPALLAGEIRAGRNVRASAQRGGGSGGPQ